MLWLLRSLLEGGCCRTRGWLLAGSDDGGYNRRLRQQRVPLFLLLRTLFLSHHRRSWPEGSRAVEEKAAVTGSSGGRWPERSVGGGEGGSEGCGRDRRGCSNRGSSVSATVATRAAATGGYGCDRAAEKQRQRWRRRIRRCHGWEQGQPVSCPVSGTTDVEQGGVAAGRRAAC